MFEMLLKMLAILFLERIIAINMYSKVEVATVWNIAKRHFSKSIDMYLIAKTAPDKEAKAITVIVPKLNVTHKIFLILLEFSSGGHIYKNVNTFLTDSEGCIVKF